MNQKNLSQLWSLSVAPDAPGLQFLSHIEEFGLVATTIHSSPLIQSMLVTDNSLRHHHPTLVEQSTYVRCRDDSMLSWGMWRSCDIEEPVPDHQPSCDPAR